MSSIEGINYEILDNNSGDLFVLFHGMFDSILSKEIQDTKKVLSKRGYSVLMFDYPGHGKSEGRLDEVTLGMIFSASDKVMAVASAFRNIYMIGFSFGANPLIYQASKNSKTKGILLFNPASNMLELIFREKTQEDLDKYTGSHRSIKLGTKIQFFIECLMHNNYSLARKITCSTYIYHIKNDDSVPVAQSKRLAACMKNSVLVSQIKSGHGLEKEIESGEYRDQILIKALRYLKK